MAKRHLETHKKVFRKDRAVVAVVAVLTDSGTLQNWRRYGHFCEVWHTHPLVRTPDNKPSQMVKLHSESPE